MGFLGIKSGKEKDRLSQEKIARMQMLASLSSNLKPLSGIGGGNSMAAARKGGEMGGVTSLHPDSKDLKKIRKK